MLEELHQVELELSGCGLLRCFDSQNQESYPLKHWKSPKKSLRRSNKKIMEPSNKNTQQRATNNQKMRENNNNRSLHSFYTSAGKHQSSSLYKKEHENSCKKIRYNLQSQPILDRQKPLHPISKKNSLNYGNTKFPNQYVEASQTHIYGMPPLLPRSSNKNSHTSRLNNQQLSMKPANLASFSDFNQAPSLKAIRKQSDQSVIKMQYDQNYIRHHKNSFNSINANTESTTTNTNVWTECKHQQFPPKSLNNLSDLKMEEKQLNKKSTLQTMTNTYYQPRQYLNSNIFKSYGVPSKIPATIRDQKQIGPFEINTKILQKSRSQQRLVVSFIEEDSDLESVVYETHRENGTEKITTLF